MTTNRTEKVRLVTKASNIAILRRFQSTEETRYYLNGINVRRSSEGGIILCATDGHRLGAIHDKDGILEGADDIIFTVSRGMAKSCEGGARMSARKVYVHDKGIGACIDTGDDYDKVKMIPTSDRHLFMEHSHIIDGTFPQYAGVFPQECGSHRSVHVNTAYLESFGFDSEGRIGRNGITVYHGKDQHDPIVILVNSNKDFVGVLMPLRGDAPQDNPLPDWIKPVVSKYHADKKAEQEKEALAKKQKRA